MHREDGRLYGADLISPRPSSSKSRNVRTSYTRVSMKLNRRCRKTQMNLALGVLLWLIAGAGWFVFGGGRALVLDWRMARVEAALRKANPEWKGSFVGLNPFRGASRPDFSYMLRNKEFLYRYLFFMPYSIEVNGANLADLSPLQGLCVERLEVHSKQFKDLTPCRHIHMNALNLSGTSVTDLEPLRGMQVKAIILSNTPVSYLSPLKDSPLQEIYLCNTQVGDLTPLKGKQIGIDITNTPAARKPLPDWLIEQQKKGKAFIKQ